MAGFKLEYRSGLADKITLRGHAEYTANVSPSPVGSISSLEHAARCIEDHVMRTRAELERCRKNVAELNALNGAVFEHEERYRELLKRQGELVDLLDITKNQAAENQATEAKEGIETVGIAESAKAEDESPAQSEALTSADVGPNENEPTKERPKERIVAVKRQKSSSTATVRTVRNNPGKLRIAV